MSNRRFTVVTDITVTNKIQMKVVINFATDDKGTTKVILAYSAII